MLDFSEATDQLALANSVHWHGHAFKNDGYVLRGRMCEVKEEREGKGHERGGLKKAWRSA